MIRTIEQNSKEETESVEMEKMKEDFIRSGYQMKDLEGIEQKARELTNTVRTQEESETLTFPLFFFEEIESFKKMIKDSETDLRTIIGDTKIIMAIKKNPSIGSTVLKNKVLSTEEVELESQMWCNELFTMPTSYCQQINYSQQYQSEYFTNSEL